MRIILLIFSTFFIQLLSSQEDKSRTSLVSFPFHISLESLSKDINEALGVVMYKDSSLTDNDNDQLQVLIQRKGPLKITGSTKNILLVDVPVKLWIQKGVGALGYYKYGATTIEVHLYFKIGYAIKKDWTLKTKTEPSGFKILNSPTFRVSGMSIPIRPLVSKVLEYTEDRLASEIDKQISENVNLKENMLSIWNELSKPTLVSEEYKSWLTLEPIQIYSTPFKQNFDEIYSTMGLRLRCYTTLGEEPEYKTAKDIPPIKYVKGIGENFKLYTQAILLYDELNNMGENMMVGQEYEFGKKKIKITALNIKAEGEKTKIKVSTTGSYKGDIFFEGIPTYDTASKVFYMNHVQMSIKTKNILHKTVGWMLNGMLESKVEKSMAFELAEKLEESRKEIEASLNKTENGVTISSSIKNIDVESLQNGDENIIINIVTKGNLKIEY